METCNYSAVVRKLANDEGGGYWAIAPDLPGCLGTGETILDALNDLRLAIDEWIDECVRLGRPVPAPNQPI